MHNRQEQGRVASPTQLLPTLARAATIIPRLGKIERNQQHFFYFRIYYPDLRPVLNFWDILSALSFHTVPSVYTEPTYVVLQSAVIVDQCIQ